VRKLVVDVHINFSENLRLYSRIHEQTKYKQGAYVITLYRSGNEQKQYIKEQKIKTALYEKLKIIFTASLVSAAVVASAHVGVLCMSRIKVSEQLAIYVV